MVAVVIPPEYNHHSGYRVFLAGAIDMGAAVDWQAQMIERLKDVDDLVIFNPRRPNFSPETLDEQIEWELDHLEKCDTIFMWLPKDAKAPISFFEAGLYWFDGKLLIGADPGFYRRRNLEMTANRYGQNIFESLEDMEKRLRLDIMSANENTF
jgi:Nucleoside 2-deoxyribosyltransferase like